MRTILITTFCFISTLCHSQQGIGIVMIEFDDNTTVNFYNSSELDQVTKTIRFFNDESINSWNIKDLEDHKKWLRPESLWLDYFQFYFRCKTTLDNSFEVYVSETQTMWIKKTEQTKYKTWEEYLKGMFSVERIDPFEQQIFKSSDLESEVLKYSGNECFGVKTMKGDWIEIYSSEICSKLFEINSPIKSGWIKWKEGNKILIRYYTTS